MPRIFQWGAGSSNEGAKMWIKGVLSIEKTSKKISVHPRSVPSHDLSSRGYKALIYQQTLKSCEFTNRGMNLLKEAFSSYSIACIDAREGIFSTFLTASSQCIQSFTHKSH